MALEKLTPKSKSNNGSAPAGIPAQMGINVQMPKLSLRLPETLAVEKLEVELGPIGKVIGDSFTAFNAQVTAFNKQVTGIIAAQNAQIDKLLKIVEKTQTMESAEKEPKPVSRLDVIRGSDGSIKGVNVKR